MLLMCCSLKSSIILMQYDFALLFVQENVKSGDSRWMAHVLLKEFISLSSEPVLPKGSNRLRRGLRVQG